MPPPVPGVAVQFIRRLPFGRRTALRLYNRALMHLRPRHRVRTEFGALLDCDVRDMIQSTLTHFGVWEPSVTNALARRLGPDDVAVDVGANIGYYSLLFAQSAGSVVAVEAHPRLAQTVRHHAELNQASNIRITAVAVSDQAGTLSLFEAPSTNVGMTTTRPERGFPSIGTVPALPLDQILSPDEMTRCALIKIDIEGAEPPVIRRFLETIDRYPRKPALAVEISSTSEWKELWPRLIAHGYRAFDLHNDYDWLAYMRPSPPPTELTDLPATQTDVLFIRN